MILKLVDTMSGDTTITMFAAKHISSKITVAYAVYMIVWRTLFDIVLICCSLPKYIMPMTVRKLVPIQIIVSILNAINRLAIILFTFSLFTKIYILYFYSCQHFLNFIFFVMLICKRFNNFFYSFYSYNDIYNLFIILLKKHFTFLRCCCTIQL